MRIICFASKPFGSSKKKRRFLQKSCRFLCFSLLSFLFLLYDLSNQTKTYKRRKHSMNTIITHSVENAKNFYGTIEKNETDK